MNSVLLFDKDGEGSVYAIKIACNKTNINWTNSKVTHKVIRERTNNLEDITFGTVVILKSRLHVYFKKSEGKSPW